MPVIPETIYETNIDSAKDRPKPSYKGKWNKDWVKCQIVIHINTSPKINFDRNRGPREFARVFADFPVN